MSNCAATKMSLIQSDTHRLVVGLGLTGLSTMRLFQREGILFSAVDTREHVADIESIRQSFPNIDIVTAAESRERVQVAIDNATEIYLSPGIAVDDGVIANAIEQGALISGDLDLFDRYVSAPVIGITGTNAKSTVTSLVGAMAQANGLNVGVGGNLGTPMLDLLDTKRDLYVLELSSFQLERCHAFNVDVACVLNLSEDHLDRHGTLMNYHRAKHRIYRQAKKVVYNRDLPLTVPPGRASVAETSFGQSAKSNNEFGIQMLSGKRFVVKGTTPIIATDEILLPGEHNLINVMAALAIGEAYGLAQNAMCDAIRSFNGLEHRCQTVAEINGVIYVNDSKATNVGATLAAIKGLTKNIDGNLILIAGGQTKGADFAELGQLLENNRLQVVLLGEGAIQIAGSIRDDSLIAGYANNMEQAIKLAANIATRGDIVLLSPACASFDMYNNYQERGEDFARLCQSMLAGKKAIPVGESDG